MDILSIINTGAKIIEVAKPIIEVAAVKLPPIMKKFSERLLKLSEQYPELEKFSAVLEKGATIISDVAFALGLKADSAEVLGYKANLSDKNVEDFCNVESYIEYLYKEINIKGEEVDGLKEAEKIAYRILGMSILTGFIAEKLGVDIPADFVITVSKIIGENSNLITSNNIKVFAEMLNDKGIKNINVFSEYLKGTGDIDRVEIGEILCDIIKAISPEADVDQVISGMKKKVREDN